MESGNRTRLADVFVKVSDPRQSTKVQHDLVELLVIAVNAVLVGADTFVEIELWAKEKEDGLRKYLTLEHGIPSHDDQRKSLWDTFGRLFGLIDPDSFEAAFRSWVSQIVPVLGMDTVVAIDGKTRWRSGKSAEPHCTGSAPLLRASASCWGSARLPRSRTRRRRSRYSFQA